jgi:prepilin signal peptidase PulO-like enzyme (type II secretory pathway)
MITVVVLTGYLLSAAIADILRKKIPVWLIVMGIFPVLLGIFMSLSGTDPGEVPEVVISHGAGALIGASFIPVSLMTREKLGKGDALLFTVCGGAAGYEKLMILIMSAFLLGALYAAAMLAMGRLTRKSSFAFAPFILAGYVMTEVLMHGG